MSKVETECHGTTPTDTAHITFRTSLADMAVAVLSEGGYDNSLATTKYVYDNAGRTCYNPGNNGLGCHATAGRNGASDETRPDWDVSFAGDNGVVGCTACHTDQSTAGVNPTSGLHSVTPSVTGQRHDNSVPNGGCTACHTTLYVQATHIAGTFQENGAVAAERTAMGLFASYVILGDEQQRDVLEHGDGLTRWHEHVP